MDCCIQEAKLVQRVRPQIGWRARIKQNLRERRGDIVGSNDRLGKAFNDKRGHECTLTPWLVGWPWCCDLLALSVALQIVREAYSVFWRIRASYKRRGNLVILRRCPLGPCDTVPARLRRSAVCSKTGFECLAIMSGLERAARPGI